MSYKARWIAQNIALDSDQIQLGNTSQVLIIRVPPGGVGRILDQGVPILLDVGTHVFNSGTIKNAGTILYANHTYFRHGKYNYVRVSRGNYAKVWVEQAGRHGVKSLVPRLVAEGEHFIESHLFQTDGLCRVDDKYIQHGTLHLISVQKGFVDKIIQENFPRLLGEGDHVRYAGRHSISMDQIPHPRGYSDFMLSHLFHLFHLFPFVFRSLNRLTLNTAAPKVLSTTR
jgi:hypothetical protein